MVEPGLGPVIAALGDALDAVGFVSDMFLVIGDHEGHGQVGRIYEQLYDLYFQITERGGLGLTSP